MEKTFNKDFDTVFKSCMTSLKELEFELEESSHQKGFIKARSSTSFLSWGENITINFQKVSTNKTKVIVKSESSQLITWGKNADNEQDIIDSLMERLNK